MTQHNLFDHGEGPVDVEPATAPNGDQGVAITPSVRATDPDTSWLSWFETEEKLPELLKRTEQSVWWTHRTGLTYTELSRRMLLPGVSTSTLLSKLERLHWIVRRLKMDGKPDSRQPDQAHRRQKIMVHKEHATREELRAHYLRHSAQPVTLLQAAAQAAEFLRRIEDLGGGETGRQAGVYAGMLEGAIKKRGGP